MGPERLREGYGAKKPVYRMPVNVCTAGVCGTPAQMAHLAYKLWLTCVRAVEKPPPYWKKFIPDQV